jgi:serine/threonine protein kinase
MPTNDSTLAPCQEFDGYHLIRFLGRGGFGEVWLCRSQTTGSYHALKFISASNSDLIEKEHHSLNLYRSAAARLRSPHLVPIEHINRHTAGLYYIMPLADGITDVDPADPDWHPQSLASRIEAQVCATAWFPSQDIIGLIHPLLDANPLFPFPDRLPSVFSALDEKANS